MAGRFDPYNNEIWNCWCPLCMDLASAHARHSPSALDAASEELFQALEAGVHVHQNPRVSLTKWNPLKHRNDGWQMREGLGIGVTPGGHMGSVRDWRQAYTDTTDRRTPNTTLYLPAA